MVKYLHDKVLKHGKVASQFLDINCFTETVSDTQNSMGQNNMNKQTKYGQFPHRKIENKRDKHFQMTHHQSVLTSHQIQGGRKMLFWYSP